MSDKVFDFKKEYKDLYMPKDNPILVNVPVMRFIKVDGRGDPNNNSDYKQAIELLYGLSYTIKMSKKKNIPPEGYFDYVVPPLEGLWWVDEGEFSLDKRDNWKWTMMLRQPKFVNDMVFKWACGEYSKKKSGLTTENACFWTFDEGLCVQMMHFGPFSTEPETMKKIDAFVKKENLMDRLGSGGKHHEIYLSDPRKSKPESTKTVLRHPVTRNNY